MVTAFRSILAIVASIVAAGLSLRLLGAAVEVFAPHLHVTNRAGQLLTFSSQVTALFVGFAAGVIGAVVMVLTAPRRPDIHLAIFVLIGLVMDGFAVRQLHPPVWFAIVLLVGVPIQAVVGLLIASPFIAHRR